MIGIGDRGRVGKPYLRRAPPSVTVCIASRSYGAVFGISDRMITSGDIQFEPPARKIHFLTSSIAIMASGDLAFHTEILDEVVRIVNERVKANPTVWMLVKDVVDLYLAERNRAKLKRAEQIFSRH